MTDWPHAPVHRLDEAGAYIVTAGTYRKEHFSAGEDRLDILQENLLTLASRYGWNLQGWSVFSNHYHFVGVSPADASSLRRLISHLHTATATAINRLDGVQGRKVWFEYWDTHLTFEKSYLARINYVYENPVRHGIVLASHLYPWCSASWFERTASPAFFKTVRSFKTDKLDVKDDYVVHL